MNRPTILSCNQFDMKVSVEMENSDVTLNEMFSMFETLVTGLGYHSTSFDNIILEKAERLRDEQESFTKVDHYVRENEIEVDNPYYDEDIQYLIKKYITK